MDDDKTDLLANILVSLVLLGALIAIIWIALES